MNQDKNNTKHADHKILLCFLLILLFILGSFFLIRKTHHLVTDSKLCRPSNVAGLWYENIPGLSRYSERYNVTWNNNLEGQRGPAISYQDGETVILFVGDSLIWGVGAEDSGTLPALVQNAQDDTCVACINLGVGSYSLWDYATILREETFEKYHPKIVVLGISTNDWVDDVVRVQLAWTSYFGRILSPIGAIPPEQEQVNVSLDQLIGIFGSQTAAESWQEAHPNPSKRDLFLSLSTFDNNAWMATLDPLEEIIQSCEENNSQLIVICFAQEEEFLPGFEDLRPQQILIDHLQRIGIKVIIGHDILANDINPFRFFPFENDNMHINQDGYEVYAQELLSYFNF